MAAAKRWLPLAAVCLSALAAPSAAQAAFATQTGGVLEITAGGEQNGVNITLGPEGYMIEDSAGMGEGAGCNEDQGGDPLVVACPAAGVNTLRIVLGDGNDGLDSDVNVPADIEAGDGNDTIDGGDAAESLDGGPGVDRLTGSGGADDIEGREGNDVVDGEVGDDTVDGGVADDVVRGGTGNDLLRPGPGPGPVTDSDEIVGGEGIDHVTFATRTSGVTVTLNGQRDDGVPGETDDVQSDVEQVTGSSAADVLGGNTGANGLNGGPGADRLAGDGGDDALDGGGDPDVADGGDGNDSVAGGAGDDDVAGGNGDDVVNGSVAALVGADGNDRVSGGAGNDLMGGGDADDSLDGGPGADVMGGGPGTDTAEYSNHTAAAKVTVAGASAVNVRVSFNGRADDGISKENDNVGTDVENATTGAGNDTLRGGAGANGLTSGAGQDFLVGNRGGDVMSAGNDGDVILARDGSADGLDCGAGRDFAVVDKRETSTTGCEFLDKGNRNPSLGRRFIVRPLRGSALGFGAPGMTRWAPLAQTLQLPVQARVRARGGAVRLISANRSGRQSAVVGGASFVVKQARRGNGLTELSLRGGNFAGCASAGEATAAGSRRVRRLFGRGRGRFRTRGRNSSATVRGTSWSVEDRCDGTLTRVSSGVVRVRDFGLRRTIVLRAGDRYLAKTR